MSTWAVVYVIHVHTPYRHIPQLFIENVPEEIEQEIKKEDDKNV